MREGINFKRVIVILLALVVAESLVIVGMKLLKHSDKKPVEPHIPKRIVTLQKEILPPSIVSIQPQTNLEDVLIEVAPISTEDVVSIDTPLVKPIIYTQTIKLSTLSIQEKKKRFIDMMLPSILVAKYRITNDRIKVGALLQKEKLLPEESLWLKKKKYIFKAFSYDDLHEKMEVHPTSIVLAQAIIESGWGTSRFFEKANNVFGVWSFKENEKRIEASQKRGKKRVYLKKYASVEQSIFDYFIMLSTKKAYAEFREKRLESNDPMELVEYLGRYSELGKAYIDNLKNTIEKNGLMVYDTYALDI